MKSGIYSITNLLDNKQYIGSSINIVCRWKIHRLNLLANTHHSRYLQNAYNKYGKDAFKFEVLFTCPKEDLLRIEQYCINNYKPQYNMSPTAGNCLGVKHTKESSYKKSQALLGRTFSKETLSKMKVAALSRGISSEHKLKMNISKVGRKIPSKNKSIYSIDNLGKIIIYNSITQASVELNISRTSISNVLSGRSKSAGSLTWKYNAN